MLHVFMLNAGNTKGGSISVLLTSCLTALVLTVWLLAKQTNPNQSNRGSMVQWYFPHLYSLLNVVMLSVVAPKTKSYFRFKKKAKKEIKNGALTFVRKTLDLPTPLS
jgi:hypothetical protein